MYNKRVLIDAERLRQPHSGLGQVALNLGREFLNTPSEHWSPVFLLPADREHLFAQAINCERPSWQRRHLAFLCPRYDAWHILHQDAAHLPQRGTPCVLTIHDLNFLEEKPSAKAKRRLAKVQRLVDRADIVTVISEFTRNVVAEHLRFADTPVEVVYNGLCTSQSASVQIQGRPAGIPEGDFLFTIGMVRKKKNFHVLIDLLAQLKNINLVIAGNTDSDYVDVIKRAAAVANISERVFFTGEVSEERKTWLFENCKAFVFPSLYEGFGLPVLEAMSFGKPVFSASRTSLPEIGGEDVFYWDDFDAATMLAVFENGMQTFVQDVGRAGRLKARAAGFSWQNAARDYAEIYQRLLNLN